LCPITAQIQSLAQKFATQENKEFSNQLQRKILDEQGKYSVFASDVCLQGVKRT